MRVSCRIYGLPGLGSAGMVAQRSAGARAKGEAMDLELTDEQAMLQQTARDFGTREVEPRAKQLDQDGEWPTDLVKRLGELGLLGIAIEEEYGGAGFDHVGYALAMEEISRACASVG